MASLPEKSLHFRYFNYKSKIILKNTKIYLQSTLLTYKPMFPCWISIFSYIKSYQTSGSITSATFYFAALFDAKHFIDCTINGVSTGKKSIRASRADRI